MVALADTLPARNSEKVVNRRAHLRVRLIGAQTRSQPLVALGVTPLRVRKRFRLTNLHRWYDPQVGRWASEDPIGFGGADANLYRYVFNAPLLRTDPTGKVSPSFDPSRPDRPIWPGGPIPTDNYVRAKGHRSNALLGHASDARGLGKQQPVPLLHGVPEGVTPEQIATGRAALDYFARQSTGFSYNTLLQLDSDAVDMMLNLQAVGQAGNALCDVASIGRSINAARNIAANRGAWRSAANAADELADAPFAPGSAGAAKVWTTRARLKAAQLPTSGRIRYVPPRNYSPGQPLPRGPQKGYIDRFGNEWVRGQSRTAGEAFEWDVQLSKTGQEQIGWLSSDGQHVNVSLGGHVTH